MLKIESSHKISVVQCLHKSVINLKNKKQLINSVIRSNENQTRKL